MTNNREVGFRVHIVQHLQRSSTLPLKSSLIVP